jgi:tetratricopeptide (TPR) repeat protein
MTKVIFLCSILSIQAMASGLDIVRIFSQSPATLSLEVRQSIDLIQNNKLAEAIELLQSAVKKNSEDADAWQYLGVALSRQGKTDEARRAYEQAARLRPDSAAPHTGLAHCFLLSGKIQEAEKAAQRALKLNPKSDEARYFLATIRLNAGKPFDAVEEVEKAIELNPSFAAAFALKTRALIEVFSRVIDPKLNIDEAIVREQTFIFNYHFGMMYDQAAAKKNFQIEQGERFDRAIEVLDRALSGAPQAQDAVVWRQMAESLRYWKPWILDYDKKPANPPVAPLNKLTSRPRIIQAPEFRGVPSGPAITATTLVLLSEDGKVLHKLMTRRAGLGLSPLVLSLTEKITFAPATQDGRNVATIALLKYKFVEGRVEISMPDK